MRQSHTAVLARNERWEGAFETEPYETAWASEAIFFVRILHRTEGVTSARVRVQVSPDGVHWCDEGTVLELSEDPEVPAFARIRHFGGWLRLTGEMPAGVAPKVLVYLSLKE